MRSHSHIQTTEQMRHLIVYCVGGICTAPEKVGFLCISFCSAAPLQLCKHTNTVLFYFIVSFYSISPLAFTDVRCPF